MLLVKKYIYVDDVFILFMGGFFIRNKKQTMKYHKIQYIKMSDGACITKNLKWKVPSVTLGQSVYKEQIYFLFNR